ncbi:MAG: glucose 1-dehydrogenase [Chloroflexota bacterium]
MGKLRLENKVAIITGGSSGLGLATAKLFLDEGAFVYICDVDTKNGVDISRSINDKKFQFLELDVSVEQQWRDVVTRIRDTRKKIDVLVNNAAISNSDTRWDVVNTTFETWNKAMAVNSSGVFLGMKEVIKVMIEMDGGSIINVSSIYGKVGSLMGAVYHSAKGSVTTLTKAAAIQYASKNIRVNSVHPGFLETKMTEKFHNQPGVREERNKLTPLGRIGVPEDVAYGILYLASDESSWVTGSELVIDGGFLAR